MGSTGCPEALETVDTPVDTNNGSGVEAKAHRKQFESRYTNLFILCNNCFQNATPHSNNILICVKWLTTLAYNHQSHVARNERNIHILLYNNDNGNIIMWNIYVISIKWYNDIVESPSSINQHTHTHPLRVISITKILFI